MASDYRDRCKHFAGTRTTRRHFFERISDGIYGTALATLLSQDLYGGVGPLAAGSTDNSGLPPGHRRFYDLKPRSPHFPSETKAVIHLFMNGGPSHVDLFDPKPTLDRNHGQTHSTAGGQTDVDRTGKLMRSPFEFKQYGKSGIWVSDLLPSLAQHVDDISVIRSMHTVHFNHEQALLMAHSGRAIAGRPSPAGRRSAPGLLSDWVVKIRICPPTLSWTILSVCRSTGCGTGSPASCLPSTRERACDP